MIHVVKDFENAPEYLAGGGNDYNHEDVREALEDIYHQKCCYCEQIIEYREVEHYRPKNSVKERSDHDGYGWLKLEWSNLLYSCKWCNAGKGGKHTKFPIIDEANRVMQDNGVLSDRKANSDFLLNEEPLLLHPEIDNPEEFLTITHEGKLEAINDNGRGKETISICNLNREVLVREFRKKVIDDIFKDLLETFFSGYEVIEQFGIKIEDRQLYMEGQLERVFLRINKGKVADQEFSLLHRIFYQKFEEFLIENTEIKKKVEEGTRSDQDITVIKQAFAAFKAANP